MPRHPRADISVHVCHAGYRSQADLYGRRLVVIITDPTNAPVMVGDDELELADPILRLAQMTYSAGAAAMTARLYGLIASMMDGGRRPVLTRGPREPRRRHFVG